MDIQLKIAFLLNMKEEQKNKIQYKSLHKMKV
jgi:hypothetical protein